MKNKFTRGFLTGLALYISGVLLYCILGYISEPYAHGPGLHHIMAVWVLLAGIAWLIGTLLFRPFRTNKYHLGIISIHLIVLVTTITWLIVSLSTDRSTEGLLPQSSPTTITITIDSASRSSTFVNEEGDTLYHKVRDSTLIDSLNFDSTPQR